MLASPPVPLTTLIAQVEGSISPETTEGAWLLRVVGPELGRTIGLLPLDTESSHPLEALLGFRADPSWRAVGLIVHGTARSLDGSGAAGERRPIRAVYAVTSEGEEASLLRYLDDPDGAVDPGPAEGRLGDCCKRILGLPTAPPEVPLLHWLATVWLSAVLAERAAHPTAPLDWSAIVALHPLADGCATEPAPFAAHVLDHLATATWDTMRFEVAAGTVQFGGLATLPNALVAEVLAEVPPTVAGWMDEGMFARWLLSSHPDPIDLLIDLADLLAGNGLEPLLQVLQAWGLW